MSMSSELTADLAQEALHRFASIVESSDDAIISKNLDGVIESWNRGAQLVFGYTAEEMIGQPMGKLIPAERQHEEDEILSRLRRGEKVDHFETVRIHKNGQHINISVTISPIRNAAGRIVGASKVARDITELKKKEIALQQAKEAAEVANRSKSEFLANMSHEIRTPLTAILGFADLLRDDADTFQSPRERSAALDTISEAGRHLLTVINDILDLSKIDAGKLTVEQIEFSLLGMLREVASLFRPRCIGKGIAFDVKLTTPVPETIVGDPTRLRQILMNLIGNAIKFTEAGSITVTVALLRHSDESRLVMDVQDTGRGMTLNESRRLFQSFHQADNTMSRKYGGTGLGLMICRRLARLMGGNVILAHSLPDQGTCFRLELPAITGIGNRITTQFAETSINAVATPTAIGTLDGRILLAEDGPDNQRLIGFYLQKAGADVDIASNGRIALEMLEQSAAAGRPYNLLVTDIQMPEMDGYELSQTLRQQGSRLPIIALTAHAMSEDRQRCLNAGCDDYATKPVDRVALIAACQRWIRASHEYRLHGCGASC